MQLVVGRHRLRLHGIQTDNPLFANHISHRCLLLPQELHRSNYSPPGDCGEMSTHCFTTMTCGDRSGLVVSHERSIVLLKLIESLPSTVGDTAYLRWAVSFNWTRAVLRFSGGGTSGQL